MEKITLLILLIAFGNCAAVNNTCTSVGKFIADVNCTSYVVCSKMDTQLTSYTIPCPTGFIVRHTDMVCSKTGTQCDPSFACTSVGNFTNPASVNASIYISCIQGIGDMVIATLMECPEMLEFNASLGRCELKTVQGTVQTSPAETTVQDTAAVASVATSATAVAANELAEPATVIPPTVAPVTQNEGRKANSSSFLIPSYQIILSTVFALLLFYEMNIDVQIK